MADSLLAQAAKTDWLADLMKDEFVPVTSFIHTIEMGNYEHIYQAYDTPANYYAQNYYKVGANGTQAIRSTTRPNTFSA